MTFAKVAAACSEAELAAHARLLSALGHPIRLRIVEGLLSGRCCVGNMAICLELPQPLVSRHLAVLREAGVVGVEQRGRLREYRVIDPRAAEVIRCLHRTFLHRTFSNRTNRAANAAKE